jgi:uncharacterized protein
MSCDCDRPSKQQLNLSRRTLLQAAGSSAVALASSSEMLAAIAQPGKIVAADQRFPHFPSKPVPYFNVRMQDTLWAPRQKIVREVTIPWATRHWDESGGLNAYKAQPATYKARTQPGDMEAIKFIEAMAAVVGLERDPAIEGLVDAWAKVLIDGQGPDGYLQSAYRATIAKPPTRWQAFTLSHESYLIGHYLESAIGYRESTGSTALYDSALRAIDNMTAALLDSGRPYISGHPEIEHAMMRLYEYTGNTKYLRMSAWFIAQRGNHKGRKTAGKWSQDHAPIQDQRTIEGHAVCAGFLFNGVTEYVGATGHAGYKEAVIAIWKDLVEHKLYLQGAGGNTSSKFEGYLPEPYNIEPTDTYGESCATFANFQWAHSLSRMTGDASYLDVAERMLYNAFYSSLSLQGDRYFYRNVSQIDDPVMRYDWHPVPCCPPNIVKLVAKIGGFLYSTDKQGIFVKHYGASQANIPFGKGVKLIQRGNYPWSEEISIQVEPKAPIDFTLRLRVPAWTQSHSVAVNGKAVQGEIDKGWLAIRRQWKAGDVVELSLPMTIQRVRLPPQFKQYEKLAALQRGPIVYCIEEQDSPAPVAWLYYPQSAKFTAEFRPNLLGGVTVLKGSLPQYTDMYAPAETPVPVMFVPYGLWNNRKPGVMRIWLPSEKPEWEGLFT